MLSCAIYIRHYRVQPCARAPTALPGGLLCCSILGAIYPGPPCSWPLCALYGAMLSVLLSSRVPPVPLLLSGASSLGLPGLSSSCSTKCVPAFVLLAPFLFGYVYQVFGGVCSLLGPALACFLSASSESCLPPRPSFSPSPFPLFCSGSLSVCPWACSVRPCEGRIKRGSPAFYFSSGPVTGARPVPPSGEKVPSHCPSPT